MRECRGKRKDNGEWIKGWYFPYGEMHFILPIEAKDSQHFYLMDYAVEVIPETVGQYTGLTDKNGVKIFEGDIVKMPSHGGGKHKTAVYFKNGKFAVDGSNYGFKDIAPRNMEVIGNIHDISELLGGV